MVLLKLLLDAPSTLLTYANLVYQRSTEINWTSFLPSDCWFQYTLHDGRVQKLFAAEVTSHERADSGELHPPQIFSASILNWTVKDSNWCVIDDIVAHWVLHTRSD